MPLCASCGERVGFFSASSHKCGPAPQRETQESSVDLSRFNVTHRSGSNNALRAHVRGMRMNHWEDDEIREWISSHYPGVDPEAYL